jgi:hypothetical protein
MDDLIERINAALQQPPGSTQLLDEALRAVIRSGLDTRQVVLAGPSPGGYWETLHAILVHLAGGPWRDAYSAADLWQMGHEPLLALGLADAPIELVETAIQRVWTVADPLLLRRGEDPETLLAMAERFDGHPTQQALICAAIARSKPVSPALEQRWTMENSVNVEACERAFEALGPERAGAVVRRRLVQYDGEGPHDFRYQALAPLLERLGPSLDDATVDAVFDRAELITRTASGWSGVGDLLGRHRAHWSYKIAQIERRILACASDETRAGWRHAMRALLNEMASAKVAIDPALDQYIDPAAAALVTDAEWNMVKRLLDAIGLERSDAVLDAAVQQYAKPTDVLRFIKPGLSPRQIDRMAEAYVGTQFDGSPSYVAAGTNIAPLGPEFTASLMKALADVKPKKGFLTTLSRKLDPQAFATLSAWLETRPEPKPKKAAKKPAKA